MGALKKFLHSWLEDYGYELGYDMGNIPDLSDLDRVDLKVIADNFVQYGGKK